MLATSPFLGIFIVIDQSGSQDPQYETVPQAETVPKSRLERAWCSIFPTSPIFVDKYLLFMKALKSEIC